MTLVDDLTCYILTSIWEASLEGKELTTWSIAEGFFDCNKQDKNRFLTKKCTMVYFRLKKMKKDGWVEIKKDNGKEIFIINNDKIVLKKTKFPDNKIRNSICIKDDEKGWMIFQV